MALRTPGYDETADEEHAPIADNSASGNQTAPGKSSYNRGGADRSNLRNREQRGGNTSTGNSAGNNPDAGGAKDAAGANNVGDIRNSEAAPETSTDNSDKLGQGYTGGNNTGGRRRVTFLRSNRNKAIIGSGAVVAGVIAVTSIGSGPFEFVHFAQLLEQFHFSSQENESDARFSKIIRYAHYAPKGQAYRTNMNYLGNKLADKFEAKLNAQGFKSAYTTLFGLKQGLVIDREHDSFKGKSDEEIKQLLREKYGSNISFSTSTIQDSTGKPSLLMEQPSGYRSARGIVRVTLQDGGNSHLTSSIAARVMGTRDGVDWHPLKKLDNKLFKTLDEKYAKWQKDKITENAKGAAVDVTNENKAPPGNTTADQQAQQAAGTAQDSANSIEAQAQTTAAAVDSGGDTSGKLTSAFQTSVKAKIGLGGLAAAGVLCMARGIAQNAGTTKQAQVKLPAVRQGVRILSEGSQIMAGGSDVDINQVGLDSKQLYDTATKLSWYQSDAIQAELGLPQANSNDTKPDKALTTINSGTALNFLLSGTLGTGLDAVCSAPGQAVQIVVGFLGGPVSFLGQQLVGSLVGPPAVAAVSNYLSGQALPVLPKGPALGNIGSFGAHFAAADQATSAGGRALKPAEVAVLDASNNSDARSQFDKHSLAYRLFSPYDRSSLLATIMDRQSNNIGTNFNNVALATLNIGYSFASTFSSIFSGFAKAATPTPYDYGTPDAGFSVDEMDNPNVANPYANGDDVATLLDNNGQAGEPDYITRAQQCFGDTLQQITVTTDSGASIQVWDVKYGTDPVNTFTQDYKDIAASCDDITDTNWIKIRFFIFDTQNIKADDCYEGDATTSDQSCPDVGFGNASGSSSTGSSSTTTATTPVAVDPNFQIKKLANPIPGAACGCTINPKGITLHWWGNQYGQGIQPLVDTFHANGLSVQVAVTSDGEVYQMTKNLNDKANHAIGGNATTIGIEIEGAPADFGKAGITKYPKKFAAVVATVKYLVNRYSIPLDGPTTCDAVVGIHPHKAYNNCPGASQKSDIDDAYFNAVMQQVRQ